MNRLSPIRTLPRRLVRAGLFALVALLTLSVSPPPAAAAAAATRATA